MATSKLDQRIDRVDDEDRVIGTIRRGDVFDEGANFRTAHVFVLDTHDRLLVQEIAPDHPRHPTYWGSSVAGYVYAGEDHREAAERRTREELGIPTPGLTHVGTFPMEDEGCTKFVGLFRARHDGPFDPDPREIASLEFVPVPELARMVERRERDFTPTFRFLLDAYRRRG